MLGVAREMGVLKLGTSGEAAAVASKALRYQAGINLRDRLR